MALATRCPNCQAMFRVVSDQLKLRGGLVRCGSCRHVFDAIGSLSYVEDAALSTTDAAPAPTTAAAPAPLPPPAAQAQAASPPAAPPASTSAVSPLPASPSRSSVVARAGAALPSAMPAAATAVPSAVSSAEAPPADPLAVPTLMSTRDAAQAPATAQLDGPARHERASAPPSADHADDDKVDAGPSTARPGETVIAPAQDDSERATRPGLRFDAAAETPGRITDVRGDPQHASAARDEAAEEAAPAFLRQPERSRGFSVVFGGGSLLLSLLMLLQLAVAFRTEIVTRWPELRPRLVDLCAVYGCSVGWPTRADLLAVIGTELQAVPGTDILELTAVIRNRASFRVALPAVEVTLTDTANRTLARKVFAPVDYLASSGEPSSRINEGLGAGSDHVVKITFEARGLSAAGFVVYPFYL